MATFFDTKQLSNIKRVEISYKGKDNQFHGTCAEVKYVSSEKFTAIFAYEGEFDIDCPQNITIKYVIDNALYISNTTLDAVKRVGKDIYFTIDAPKTMSLIQKRKYYRVNLSRTCVLVCTDRDGHTTPYLSRVVDISAGGVLMHQLESMFEDRYITIEPLNYVFFNIVLFLDLDIVLKLSARYVRQEKENKLRRYAFEFTDMKPSDINTLMKYVAKEQLEQLKSKNI